LKKHIKVYLEGMYIPICERFEDMYIRCEWCNGSAVDVHHLDPRGRGSSKLKDYLENLVGLCRKCHLKAEARQIDREELKKIHLRNIEMAALQNRQ
jgi:hypothetical protein